MALIYIVEDDESIGMLIQAALNAAAHETRLMVNAAELEKAIEEEIPALLLLDIMLPGKDGWTVLAEWKSRPRTADVPVVILSAKSEELDKVRGLESGAEDYITKPFGVLELQARVKTVLRRSEGAASSQYRLNDLTMDIQKKEVRRGEEEIRLTRREMELLEYLFRNAGQVVSREQLLEAVWDYRHEAETTRTVDYHVASLRQKLGGEAQNQYIETVRGFGYRMKKE